MELMESDAMAVVTSFVVEQSPLVAGAAGTGRVAARLRGVSSLPGQPGWVAAAPILRIRGSGGALASPVDAISLPQGEAAAAGQATLPAGCDAARQQAPQMRRTALDSVRDPAIDLRTGQPAWEPNERRERCIDPDQPVSSRLPVIRSEEDEL
jgi:hypothetical protein